MLGAVVVVTGLLSFVDPTGSRGGVVSLGILGGVLASFVAVQRRVAPTVRLPASRSIVRLVAGALAALGFVLAGLTYLPSLFDVQVFSLIFDIGLFAALALLWSSWRAYQAEQGNAGRTSPPPAPPAA